MDEGTQEPQPAARRGTLRRAAVAAAVGAATALAVQLSAVSERCQSELLQALVRSVS